MLRIPYRSPLVAWLLAVVAPGAALAFKHFAGQFLPIGAETPYLMLGGAVMVVAWYGGLLPGLFSTVAGGLAVIYHFVPPFDSWDFDAKYLAGLALFLAEGTVISLLAHSLHEAQDQVQRTLERALQRERQLAESERLANVGSAVLDLASGRTTWTDQMYRLLGYEPDAHAPEPDFVDRHVALEDRDRVAPFLQHGSSGSGPDEVACRLVRRDGTTIHARIRVRIERTAGGGPLRAQWTVQDVSDRVRDEETRRALEERVERARRLESLGVLAGGVAHDYNNLLTVVGGYLELALAELPPESPVRTSLEKSRSAAARGTEIGAQMLAYSGHGVFLPTPADLNAIVRETLAPIADDRASHRIALDLSPDPLPILADVPQVQRALTNLVTNAIEARGEHPVTIAVRTRRERFGEADLASRYDADLPGGDYAVLEVADDGIGMDAARLSRAFEPFFTTHLPGRGLGLPVVLGIARGHHGAVRLDSRPGIGTTAQLLLPCSGPRAQAPAEP